MSSKVFPERISRTLNLSPEMAKDLGMKTWREASAWAALIDTVRRVLGLPERAAIGA